MAQISNLIVDSQNILDKGLVGYSCELDEEETELEKHPVAKTPRTGLFCEVYKFSNGSENKCFRIWRDKKLFQVMGIRDRLMHIEKYLKAQRNTLPYFVEYELVEEALRDSDGSAYPGLRMAWVDGKNLGKFIKQNQSPQILTKLANNFYEMLQCFSKLGIAHGDLSNANIYVLYNGDIRLVDYDSIYVPSMSGQFLQSTGGAAEFQHPERIKNHAANSLYASAKDDNFAGQVIYLSLLAISHNPDLVNLISDKELLFTHMDYANESAFISSRGYKEIVSIDSTEVKARLEELRMAVKGKLQDVRSVVDFNLHNIPEPPKPLEEKTPTPEKPVEREPPKTAPKDPTGKSPNSTSRNPTGNTPNNTPRNPTGNTPNNTPRNPTGNTPHNTPRNPTTTYPRTTSQPTTSWYKQWYIWVGIIAMIGVLAFAGMKYGNKDKAESSTQTAIAITTAINRLDGNYTFRETDGGMLVNGIRTAAIKKVSGTQARILVTSEYGPEFYDFTLNTNGGVESEQLGIGEITYKENLDKITLTFKQGERICEFTK